MAPSTDPNPVLVLKVDIANAYNSISRREILEAVGREIPELLPYSHFALQEDTKVFFTSRDRRYHWG
jgi:hypothetical protein